MNNQLEAIKRQMEALYWECGLNHDKRSADFFYKGIDLINETEELIKDCIELLKVSGKNTKKEVQEKLKDLLGDIL